MFFLHYFLVYNTFILNMSQIKRKHLLLILKNSNCKVNNRVFKMNTAESALMSFFYAYSGILKTFFWILTKMLNSEIKKMKVV